MSQLDQIVASVEDSILPGMNYSLNNRKSASCAHQRVLSTFFPTTSGVYSPASQRSVKIMFSDSGNGFLDLSTIRINLRIRNTDGTNPLPLTGGHSACIFQRLQSRIRSQLVDDVLYYGRLVGMLHRSNTPWYNYKNNVAMTGTEDNGHTNVLAPPAGTPLPTFICHGLALNGHEEEFIAAGHSRAVVFDLPGCSATNSHFS